MRLAPSAHVDTFCRDRLPPMEQWPELIFEVPEVQYPERLNCAVELLDAQVEAGRGDAECLRSARGESWSYRELLERSNRLANLLVDQHGLVPGNRVLLRGPNNLGLVACWFAVVKAGGVVVPTMSLLRERELAAIAEVGRFDLALCDHRVVDALHDARMTDLRVLTYGDGSDEDVLVGSRSRSPEFDNCDTAADDIAMLAFTSGTTGRPKATMHFHRDILANADTFSHYVLRPAADDVFIGTPPIAFTFGLGGLIVFPMRVGAATVLVERATPGELLDLIDQHQATVCFTAPTAYKAMLTVLETRREADPEARHPLQSLRRAVSAGEHLPKATWEALLAATGLRLIDGIGSTEMLHIFISSADDEIRPGATGRVVPGFRARVIDLDGRTVPDGEPGRLAVQGPTGCRYLNDPRQGDYVQDGWNVTGDTFVRDSDGYFWYQARTDDMIISSGYNIAGPEVEEAVADHPAVLECAVVASPHDARGHVVKAFVVLREERRPVLEDAEQEAALAREIQDHVKATLAPYKYPRQVEFVTELPRTSTGKLQRFVLRAAQDGTRADASPRGSASV